jgi:hypothetical protein
LVQKKHPAFAESRACRFMTTRYYPSGPRAPALLPPIFYPMLVRPAEASRRAAATPVPVCAATPPAAGSCLPLPTLRSYFPAATGRYLRWPGLGCCTGLPLRRAALCGGRWESGYGAPRPRQPALLPPVQLQPRPRVRRLVGTWHLCGRR